MPYRNAPSALEHVGQADGAAATPSASEDIIVLCVIFVLGTVLALSGLGAGASGVTSAAIGMIMALFAVSRFVRDVLCAPPTA